MQLCKEGRGGDRDVIRFDNLKMMPFILICLSTAWEYLTYSIVGVIMCVQMPTVLMMTLFFLIQIL